MYHCCVSTAGFRINTIDLALELLPFNINGNAILPGAICTDMVVDHLTPPGARKEDFIAGTGRAVPMERVDTQKDVAGTALFLTSDLCKYVPGAEVIVGGGALWRYAKKGFSTDGQRTDIENPGLDSPFSRGETNLRHWFFHHTGPVLVRV